MKKAKEDARTTCWEESNAKIENTIRTIKEAQAEKRTYSHGTSGID